MLWEHEPQASVSTAFSSSLKLSRVSLQLNRNTENMFSISFRKHRDEKKNSLTLSKCKFSLLAPSSRQQLTLVPSFYRVTKARFLTNQHAYFRRTVFSVKQNTNLSEFSSSGG